MCTHLDPYRAPRVKPAVPTSQGCAECLSNGGRWVQLRLCLSCGHVGCCDSSPGKHATGHFHATKHPVMKAWEPGQDWAWCYLDEDALDTIPSFPEERPARHVAPPGAR